LGVASPALEVADIFRTHGPAWREAQQGRLSLGQLKVMSAIEQCRTAALGGHVLRCEVSSVNQDENSASIWMRRTAWAARGRA
jgi:hypothetical protein